MRNKFNRWMKQSLDTRGKLLSISTIKRYTRQLDGLVMFFGKDVYRMSIPELLKLNVSEETKAIEALVMYKRAVVPMIDASQRKWTIDRCKTDALKYKTRKEWYVKEPNAYHAARRNGWLNEVVKHMVTKRERRSFFSCVESAKKYNSLKEWRNSDNAAYQTSYRAGWILRIRLALRWKWKIK